MPNLHVLSSPIPKGFVRSLWQAYFLVGDNDVHVVRSVGLTQYVDRKMPLDEARKQWRELVDRGWTMDAPRVSFDAHRRNVRD